MKKDKFIEWLEKELKQRDWSQGELCRRSGLSSASVSNVLSGQQTPGLRFYQGVAQAFRISLEVVLREAELLPPKPAAESLLAKVNYYLNDLPPNEQARFLIMVKSIWEHYQSHPASEATAIPDAEVLQPQAGPVVLEHLDQVLVNLLQGTGDDFRQMIITTVRAWLIYENAKKLEGLDQEAS